MHVEAGSTGFSFHFKNYEDLRYHVGNLQEIIAECEKAQDEGKHPIDLVYTVGVELEKIISPLAAEIVGEAIFDYYNSLPGKEEEKPTPGEMFDLLAGIL